MEDQLKFTENNIQRLFGHEAAENEDPARLSEYYFKGNVFQKIMTDLPLRILIGHKGTGKSALFKVAMAEDREIGWMPVSIQPNDIGYLSIDTTNFLNTIRSWNKGLNEIITDKIFRSLGINLDRPLDGLEGFRGDLISFLKHKLTALKANDYPSEFENRILSFLDKPRITVYIDDLDRGWEGKPKDIKSISALLNAVRDISALNRDIGFRVALRSDVYYLVRTSDESTDKIEGSSIWLTWTNHEIFVLLIKRIETFFGRKVDEQELLSVSQVELANKYLMKVMEYRFAGRGNWEKIPMYRVLMSLTRKRPRDLVKLCTLAARQAFNRGASLIKTQDFSDIFEEYSHGRIQDAINEFRSELPAIEQLVMNMKPNRRERTAKAGYVYTTPALLEKLGNISESNRFQWANGKLPDSKELAAFLYKINFITARKETESGIVRKYFEENRYLSSRFVDFGFDWEVHPAYRWALQPDTIDDIYYSLHPEAE